MAPLTAVERIHVKVVRTDTCWLWMGDNKTHNGYGRMNHKGKRTLVHRVAYELVYGPIPPGHYVDHICFSRNCVRPDHLRLVTPKQNAENRKGAQVNSRSGIRGVAFYKGKWRYQVKHRGKNYQKYGFPTAEAASIAAAAKRSELFTHNTIDLEKDMAGYGIPKELTRGYSVAVGEALAKVIPLKTLTQAELDAMDAAEDQGLAA